MIELRPYQTEAVNAAALDFKTYRKVKKMIGKKLGRLTIISEAPRKNSKPYYNCLCICGNKTTVRKYNLIDSKKPTRSCGCLGKEKRSIALKKKLTKHGKCGTPTYHSWGSMIQRSTNDNNDRFHQYKGRGITVDESWLDFTNFYKDMGKRPKGKSLDRIDNNKGYSKNNCKWSTPSEQINNRSNTIKHKGKPLIYWCRKNNLKYDTVKTRIRRGDTIEQAINPKRLSNRGSRKPK